MNLEASSNNIKQWTVITMLIISFLGFLDATYLTVEHFMGAVPNCSIIKGCDIVATSQYATIGTIPIALLGSLYYLSIFLLSIVYLDTKRESFLFLASRIPLAGFFVSLYLIYLQIFVLKAICMYCMISAISSTLLFIMGIYIVKSNGHKFLKIK